MKISTHTRWIAAALASAAIASPLAQAADLPAGQPYPSGAAVLSLNGTGSLGEAPPIRSTYPSGYALLPVGSADTIVTTGPKGFDFAAPAHWQSEAAAPVQLVGEDGFDFRDAGIGGAVGLAAALLLAGAALAMRRHRDLAHS